MVTAKGLNSRSSYCSICIFQGLVLQLPGSAMNTAGTLTIFSQAAKRFAQRVRREQGLQCFCNVLSYPYLSIPGLISEGVKTDEKESVWG